MQSVCHATNRIHPQYRQRRILECHQPAASPQHLASSLASRGESKLQGPRFAQFLWFLAHFEMEGLDDAIELPDVVIRRCCCSLHRICAGVRRDADGKPGRGVSSCSILAGFQGFFTAFSSFSGSDFARRVQKGSARAVYRGRGAGEDCMYCSSSSSIINLTHNVDQLLGSCPRSFSATPQKGSIASRFASSRLVAPAEDLPAETDSTTVVPYYLDEIRHCRELSATEV